MSNPNPFFMVFIINFNVLKVYDKKTERFVKRIVEIEIYIIFNFLYDREFLLCENFYAPFYFG